jgi:nucleotide-binding universal stress UspA family protein
MSISQPANAEPATPFAPFATDWSTESPFGSLTGPLVLVVGLDTSAPATRALDSAIRLAKANDGRLEIVYVAHLPGSAGLAPQAIAELESGFDEIAQQLLDAVDSRLRDTNLTWHFQRRSGNVAHELLAAGEELRHEFGADATIGFVVGGSAHRYHRAIGSVASSLGRVDRYPFMVVP